MNIGELIWYDKIGLFTDFSTATALALLPYYTRGGMKWTGKCVCLPFLFPWIKTCARKHYLLESGVFYMLVWYFCCFCRVVFICAQATSQVPWTLALTFLPVLCDSHSRYQGSIGLLELLILWEYFSHSNLTMACCALFIEILLPSNQPQLYGYNFMANWKSSMKTYPMLFYDIKGPWGVINSFQYSYWMPANVVSSGRV